jgi:hypothetical protein
MIRNVRQVHPTGSIQGEFCRAYWAAEEKEPTVDAKLMQ